MKLKIILVYTHLIGAHGDSAGGQLAGCQYYAENGTPLLLCPLASV
jgi:hypothetical protein